jgi:hypothetical protein
MKGPEVENKWGWADFKKAIRDLDKDTPNGKQSGK